jgi:hypothetical protein
VAIYCLHRLKLSSPGTARAIGHPGLAIKQQMEYFLSSYRTCAFNAKNTKHPSKLLMNRSRHRSRGGCGRECREAYCEGWVGNAKVRESENMKMEGEEAETTEGTPTDNVKYK